jgi:hypothetical protein
MIGVNYSKTHSKFVAIVYNGGKRIHLGYFSREVDAETAVLSFREQNGLPPLRVKTVFEKIPGEIFKEVVGYRNYEASNLGRIISKNKGGEYRLLNQHLDVSGYFTVGLIDNNGKLRSRKVHQIVAVCFLDHIPNGHSLVVDHINNVKSDNRVENLQLISARKNSTKDKSNPFTGVTLDRNSNRYRARIHINGRRVHLGMFDTPEEAHGKYLEALSKHLNNN